MAEGYQNILRTITAPVAGSVATDLNNYDYLGLYFFDNTTANTPPSSSSYGLCLTLSSNEPKNVGIGWVCQIAFDARWSSGIPNNKLFIRKRINNNSWTPWSTITSS